MKLKSVLILGVLTYIALGLLAAIFFEERTIFLDMSFHLFYILKDGDFAIQNFRFGAVGTQLFPLVGQSIGLSLINIMKLYSLGFVIYYFACFIACIYFDRSGKYALISLLSSVLLVGDTFYWIQSELPQAIALMWVFFAYSEAEVDSALRRMTIYYPLRIALLFTLAFFHPLLIFPFIFVTGFLFYTSHFRNYSILSSGVMFLFFYAIKFVLFRTPYDTTSMGSLSNLITLFPNYLAIDSMRNFIQYIIEDYHLFIVVLFMVLGAYIRQRKYCKAAFVLVAFLGYLFLINVSYPTGTQPFYMENLYLPLQVFVLLPFVFDVLPRFRPAPALALMVVVICLKIGMIYQAAQPYTERLNTLRDISKDIMELDGQKVLITELPFPESKIMMTWAIPYEFWLLSSYKEERTQSVLFTPRLDNYKWALEKPDVFITQWGVFNHNELPDQYFFLSDSSKYQFLKD